MKNKILIALIIISISSCSKEETSDCKWTLDNRPQDTTLYISYDINGEHFKFYQQKVSGYALYAPIEINATKELHYYCRDIAFGKLITDDEYYSYAQTAYQITFWNYMIDKKKSNDEFALYYFKESNLSEELVNEYKYSAPNPSYYHEIELKDTILLEGVEMMRYTSDVFEHFNYDTTLINNFFSDDVYFKITDIVKVCNDYSKVSGIFSTKSINENEIINIENGKFSFITK